MLKRSRYILLSVALVTSFACGVPAEEVEEGTAEPALEGQYTTTDHTRLGATSTEGEQYGLPNSCEGVCGGQAAGGCWCDSLCMNYGDCCTDFQRVCNPLTKIRVGLYTGNDDKRSDTWVRLRLFTTHGSMDFMLSPTGQRLGDRSLHITEFPLSTTIRRDEVTGCALIVDLGEGDGWSSYRDNWWMTGLVIDGYNGWYNSLRDHFGWSYKFVSDRTLFCPAVAQALSGTYRGPIQGDNGTTATLTATFDGTPESTTGAVSITSGLQYECLGTHRLDALSFMLSGSRTGLSGGESHYTLHGSTTANGHTISIRVEGDLQGSEFNGVAHLDGPCDKQWPFSLDRL